MPRSSDRVLFITVEFVKLMEGRTVYCSSESFLKISDLDFISTIKFMCPAPPCIPSHVIIIEREDEHRHRNRMRILVRDSVDAATEADEIKREYHRDGQDKSDTRSSSSSLLPSIELEVENLAELLSSENFQGSLFRLVRVCSPYLVRLTLRSNGVMTNNHSRIPVINVARVLQQIPPERNVLRVLELDRLHLTGSLESLADVLRSGSCLEHFYASTTLFTDCDQFSDAVFARTIPSLPALIYLDFDFEIAQLSNVRKISMATEFLKSHSLKNVSFWKLPIDSSLDDSYQKLFQQARDCANLQELNFYGSHFPRSCVILMGKRLVQGNSSLKELTFSMEDGTAVEAFVESLVTNYVLECIKLYIPINNAAHSIPERAWHELLFWLKNKNNCNVKQFNIACGRFPNIDSLLTETCRNVKAELEFYLMLNRLCDRQQILTNDKLSGQCFLQSFVPQSPVDRTDEEELSIFYYILHSRPHLWLPSIDPTHVYIMPRNANYR